MVDDLDIPTIISYLIHRHVICNLAYYHIFHLTPLILYLPFALECICFHKHNVTWQELHSTSSSVIVPFLLVSLAIGLVLHFSIGFFEALSHLFNICRHSARAHMGAQSWKIEIHREAGAPPKHQIV